MTATLDRPTDPAPESAPAPARRPRGVPGALWVLVPLGAVLLAVVYPLWQVVARSFTDVKGESAGLATWQDTLGDPAVHKALWSTLQIAALSTAGCVVAGTFLALVLVFVPFPGAQFVVRMIEAVVSFPSFLIPLALGVILGPVGVANSILSPLGLSTGTFMTSVWGVVLAEVAFYTPFIVRPMLAAFDEVPRVQVDVASSLGAGTLTIVRRVILPSTLPSLAAAASLVFLLTLNEFGIVLFTGAKDVITVPMLIYTRAIVGQDFAGAAVLATIQLTLSIAVYAGYRVLTRKRVH